MVFCILNYSSELLIIIVFENSVQNSHKRESPERINEVDL